MMTVTKTKRKKVHDSDEGEIESGKKDKSNTRKDIYIPVDEWLAQFNSLPPRVKKHFNPVKKLIKGLKLPVIQGKTCKKLKSVASKRSGSAKR